MTTRRGFLTTVGGAGAAPLFVRADALGRGAPGANDRVAIGIIGTGGRGVFEAKHYIPVDGCEIVALAEVQEPRRLAAKDTFEKLYAEKRPGRQRRGIRMYNDFRELLAQKDVDAVYIATPDHWHVSITHAAMKAGKACHTEKPLGVSVEQDLAALRFVRKFRRPFLYGAERRSTPDARHGVELVLNGRIGDVREIYVVGPPSKSGGSATPEPVPKGFDYDMWLGPAPEAPFSKDRVSDGIFNIRDYSLGFIANWAAHPMDQVQWWADNAGRTVIPVTYEGAGRLASGGLYDCAIGWDLRCTYKDGLVLHFMDSGTFAKRTNVPRPSLGNLQNVALFVGTKGSVGIAYEKVVTEPASLIDSQIAPGEIHLQKSPVEDRLVTAQGIWEYPPACHQRGWIECLRAGKPFIDGIESAVRSDLICQLSDICVRTGRTIRWDPEKNTIAGDADARKLMSRPMRKPWGDLA